MKKIITFIAMFSAAVALFGCAAKKAIPEAERVVITNEKPTDKTCKSLGEVFGSQGNFFTGKYTSDRNLMMGARNEIRNKTYEKGGNLVVIQNINNSGLFLGTGTASSTIVGYAYNCK